MRYQSLKFEPFLFNSQEGENEIFEKESLDYLESEVNRNSPGFVRWVQDSLNKILRLKLSVDGKMGSATRSAIRDFQKRRGLVVDGAVGLRTEKAMKAAGASPFLVKARVPLPNAAPCRTVRSADVDCTTPPPNRRSWPGGGKVKKGSSTDPELRDIVIYNFDINDHRLKPEHEKELLDMLRFMSADYQQRKSGQWTVSISGMASNKGPEAYNDQLSERRAACVERFLRFHLFDYASSVDFGNRVVFNSCFQGFRGAPPGENEEYRAVRIAVHRPGKIPPPIEIYPACAFHPTIHGFKFDNGWTWPSAIMRHMTTPPLSNLLARMGVPVGAGGLGLCGGMVTLARDHFRFGVPIPTATIPPHMGSALFNKILDRQLDSLNLNTASIGSRFGAPIRKFAEWMKLSDRGAGSVAERTAIEFHEIRKALENGELRILGLVLTSVAGSGSLTDNHQVLARCLKKHSSNVYEIFVYDPNYHDCDDIKIRVQLVGSEALATEIVPKCPSGGPKTNRIRGFFVMPYRWVRP